MLMLVPDTWDSTVYCVVIWNQRLKGIYRGDEFLPYASKFDNMLGDLKVQAETLALFAKNVDGFLTCAIRPSNVFGPGNTEINPCWANQAKSGGAKCLDRQSPPG
ncbi:3beta-hydroxysteroid-4alpha-carboxylate 3-dehydrogenase [Sarracenia purpurea var. burkii]